MKRLVLIGLASLGITGCEMPSTDGGSASGGGTGPAAEIVNQMAERGRLPQRDYVCRLTGADRGEPYGALGIANDRYTLIAKGGGRLEGSMTVAENGAIEWDGDLGRIDDDRRVRNARVRADGENVELTFDFTPDLDGHDRVTCIAGA